MSALDVFSPETRAWFESRSQAPTPAQELGWPAIASGKHTLIQAPTGSGKTLAAFLYGIDRLDRAPGEGLRLLYVSPLKALNYDVERNLRGPLAGLELEAARRRPHRRHAAARTRGDAPRAPGHPDHDAGVALPAADLARARDAAGVETLILDEVHAVAGTKRGAHLALSVERLDRLAEQPVQRIGLSATQRPMEEIGRFVSGGAADRARRRGPREGARPEGRRARSRTCGSPRRERTRSGRRSTRRSCELVEAAPLDDRLRQQPAPRRAARAPAERAAETSEIARAHHGSLAREQRLEVEELLKKGEIPCLVATSSLELGIDMGAVDLVVQVESPKSVARGLQRVGRAGHELGAVSRGRIFPKFRADLLESAVVVERMKAGAIEETVIPRNPLDVLAQQVVAICADEEIPVDELHDLVRGAYNFADLSRVQLENVLDMLAGRYPSDEFAELRPRIVWDRTGGVIRGRSGARQLAVTNAGTIPDRGLYGVHLVDGGGRVGELDEEMVYEARAGQTFTARRVDVADRGDHARPRARLSGAGRARADPVLEGRGPRAAVRARRGDRQGLPRARRPARARRRSTG